ncbi:hypothetical protein [Vibrio sp. ABG19]|uniref:hypothetical protein n=1 Tax=Vibrio sp. ABG19 TaxID=2817385 RepID=UPI00249DDF5C|nr:hypothetical protein [Vibrio sp. ABG19]WGY44784.1 hypothetical protein J0X00_03475 [Vibrio sp. ABG19]
MRDTIAFIFAAAVFAFATVPPDHSMTWQGTYKGETKDKLVKVYHYEIAGSRDDAAMTDRR